MRCFEFQFETFCPLPSWETILEKRKIFSVDDQDDDSYWNIVGISMSWIESKMGTKGDFLEKIWTTFDKIPNADLIMSIKIWNFDEIMKYEILNLKY